MRAPSRPSNPNSSAWDEVDAEDTPLEGSEEAPARTWSSKRFGLHQHAKMGAALALAALAAPLPILGSSAALQGCLALGLGCMVIEAIIEACCEVRALSLAGETEGESRGMV